MGPLLYVATSIFLWRYLGGVFIPALLTRTVISLVPPLADLQMLVTINTNAFYFGAYFRFWTLLAAAEIVLSKSFSCGNGVVVDECFCIASIDRARRAGLQVAAGMDVRQLAAVAFALALF